MGNRRVSTGELRWVIATNTRGYDWKYAVRGKFEPVTYGYGWTDDPEYPI